MSSWIEINGAKIEKEFFDANVREAEAYDWVEIRADNLIEHVHCMICGITIDQQTFSSARAYRSEGGHVCAYCYDHFLIRRS
jgi:hypothetical protein